MNEMTSTDRNWDIKKINSGALKSTQPYQREIHQERVRYAVEHFDPNKVDIVHVSQRDGNYYVIDGQHTVRILEIHNGGKPVNVLCAVHTGMTYEDEAKYYSEQYAKKAVQTTAEIAVAKYEANDEEYREMAETLHKLGARMCYDRGHKDGIKIDSIENIIRAYRKDKETLTTAVSCLASAYSSDKRLYGNMIVGLTEFLKLYGDQLSYDRFVKVLMGTEQKTIIDKARNWKASYPLNWRECFRDLYNKSRGKKLTYIGD